MLPGDSTPHAELDFKDSPGSPLEDCLIDEISY